MGLHVFGTIYCPVLTAVVAQPSYTVEETDGSLTVCVNISGGTLARPVNVVVTTADDCAEGMTCWMIRGTVDTKFTVV